jgi:NAD(P)-dependent dehydrogenase (short-subunit alcohol dehydrogenase family)
MAERVALVTGAASGIGAATVKALVADGCDGLVLVDRDAAGLDALAAGLAPAELLALPMDVADDDAWIAAEAAVRERFGAIRHAVANAGIARGGPIAELRLAEWRAVMAVNLDGVALTLRTALRLISDGGSIVNVASVAGLKAEPNIGAYGASKAGVIHLTRVAAREVAARRVTVNAICPGGVATPLWRTQDWWAKLIESKGDEAAAFDAMAVNTPIGRFAAAGEIATAIVSLLGQPMTTGAVLVVDGGYSL